MPPYIFISYARNDEKSSGKSFSRFVKDLARELSSLTGEDGDDLCFVDTGMNPGTNWPAALSDALHTARAFIAMYSPSYFKSEFCGKEWTVFSDRCRPPAGRGGYLPLIIPVFWERVDLSKYSLDPRIAEIQYLRWDLGSKYCTEGLRYMMLSRDPECREFVRKLAILIVDTVDKHPLKATPGRVPYLTLRSAFHPELQDVAPPAFESTVGNFLPEPLGRLSKAGNLDELEPAARLERLVVVPPPDEGRKVVAISYARGDDKSDAGRECGKIVDDLQAHLVEWGFEVWRDRDPIKNCELIRDFMLTIARTRRVIVVLSDEYLRSVFRMSELHYIYQYSLGEEKDFTDRIVPIILGDAKIDGWQDRAKWARHWQAEFEEIHKDHKILSNADREILYRISTWYRSVGDMLAFIANMVTVRGAAAIAAGDFRVVREMLERPRNGG